MPTAFEVNCSTGALGLAGAGTGALSHGGGPVARSCGVEVVECVVVVVPVGVCRHGADSSESLAASDALSRHPGSQSWGVPSHRSRRIISPAETNSEAAGGLPKVNAKRTCR